MPDVLFTDKETIPPVHEHGLMGTWNGRVFTPLCGDELGVCEIPELISLDEQKKIFDVFLDISSQVKAFSLQVERLHLRLNERPEGV